MVRCNSQTQTAMSKKMPKALAIACRSRGISMAVIAGIVGNEEETVKRSGADACRSWTWRNCAQVTAAALEPEGMAGHLAWLFS